MSADAAPRFLSPEESAEMDEAIARGEVVTVDILYDDGTWQSDHDTAARARSASRADRLVKAPRRPVLLAETQRDRGAR